MDRWVIVGGESGPGARPMDVAWARSIVAQCREIRTAVFVKKLGAHPETTRWDFTGREADPIPMSLRDPKGGNPTEWPEDLRIREFPDSTTQLSEATP